MKKKFALFLLVNVFALVAACGGGGKGSESNKQFTYDLTENGCKTGSHSFNSLADMCRGLADDNLNKGCAPMLRSNRYQESRCDQVLGN